MAALVDAAGEVPAPRTVGTLPVIPVADLAARVGPLAARFYGDPASRVRVIGITGTNGKTSCSHFLAQLLAQCAVIGTRGAGFLDDLAPTGMTTPDAIALQRLLADLRDKRALAVAMEVSSHALEQQRVAGVPLDIAVYTGISQDHLDYHPDMASYLAAKQRLFRLPGLRAAVINADDDHAGEFRELVASGTRVLSYGLSRGDIRAEVLGYSEQGMHLRLLTPDGDRQIVSGLLGAMNVSNLLAVAAVLLLSGWSLDDTADAVSGLQPVPGRMQLIQPMATRGEAGHGRVVIDYAHNPQGLQAALEALRAHFPEGAIHCLFGCGGERDRSKRPLMGAVAQQFADHLILTSDNPRGEEPLAIIEQIKAGLHDSPSVVVEPDRAKAIALALSRMGPADTLLLAGKGDETVQQIAGTEVPMSDAGEVRKAPGWRA